MRKKKGFTLMELIIVMAIMAILAAIVGLAWGALLNRSRQRTLNTKSKTIFNAAQHAATDFASYERTHGEEFMTSGDFYYYWNGTTGFLCNSAGTQIAAADLASNGRTASGAGANLAKNNTKFGREVQKVLDDNVEYKVYIKNYTVQSVAVARYSGDRFIGSYPTNSDAVEDAGRDLDTLASAGVQAAQMNLYDLDTSDL